MCNPVASRGWAVCYLMVRSEVYLLVLVFGNGSFSWIWNHFAWVASVAGGRGGSGVRVHVLIVLVHTYASCIMRHEATTLGMYVQVHVRWFSGQVPNNPEQYSMNIWECMYLALSRLRRPMIQNFVDGVRTPYEYARQAPPQKRRLWAWTLNKPTTDSLTIFVLLMQVINITLFAELIA